MSNQRSQVQTLIQSNFLCSSEIDLILFIRTGTKVISFIFMNHTSIIKISPSTCPVVTHCSFCINPLGFFCWIEEPWSNMLCQHIPASESEATFLYTTLVTLTLSLYQCQVLPSQRIAQKIV